jgi:hypothetical protein
MHHADQIAQSHFVVMEFSMMEKSAMTEISKMTTVVTDTASRRREHWYLEIILKSR